METTYEYIVIFDNGDSQTKYSGSINATSKTTAKYFIEQDYPGADEIIIL